MKSKITTGPVALKAHRCIRRAGCCLNKMFKLDTSSSGFSLTNARALVRASAQAYAQRTLHDAATGTDVLVIEQPDAIIVAFRGTSEIKDWLTDARFVRTTVACGEVHSGFWAAWSGVRKPLFDLVWDQALTTGKPVLFTGHSLGGALALIAAKYFEVRGMPNVHGVYTFGAPRVGDKEFCRNYDKFNGPIFSLRERTFQIVAQGDPVPLVPTLLMGYRDCGHEIFIRNDGAVQTDPFIGAEIFADVLGAVGRWREHRLGLLPNHFIAHYDARITALYDSQFNDDTNAADFQTP